MATARWRFALSIPVLAPFGPVQGLQLLAGGDNATLIGNNQDDVAVHTGHGAVYGRGGDDLILTIAIDEHEPDEHLLLDGGEGNDFVINLGGQGADALLGLEGERAVTIGGLGRDWIYNTSDGRVIWGGIANSVRTSITERVGVVDGEVVSFADDKTNSDNIWYAPNVKVMDAGRADVLKFYGLPLTGGDANGGMLAAAVFGGIGAVAGSANFDFSSGDWRSQVYSDHILPWMTYMFQEDEDGNLDLFITNQFDQLFKAVIGTNDNADYERAKDLAREGILDGWMKIENVDVVGSVFGIDQAALAGQGTFNMVFRAANPIWAILQALPPTLITFAASGGGPLVDAAFSVVASNGNEDAWPERPFRFVMEAA